MQRSLGIHFKLSLPESVIKGVVDASYIAASLDMSRQFMTEGAEPAWRTVWNGLERAEEQFNKALKKM